MLGLLLAAVGSRLAGRCTTWCCALLGLPMWVVGGTIAPFCLALPQLMLALLAAGMGITGLAVGTALAGAVTNVGLALALCLLGGNGQPVVADRQEFCRKCLLLALSCGVIALFVRDGTLSYTGTGLLMLLFVIFVLFSIVYQHQFIYGERYEPISTDGCTAIPPAQDYGYTARTMAFPVMNLRNSLKNLAGVVGGLALLAVGARALVYSATTIANLTGTIQALWAATLISFGFCLPLLAEALGHPFGSIWKRFDARCRFYPADTLPIQLLNSAILNLTLALPISSLMYRHRLPVGAQFRAYEVPILAAMALVLLAERNAADALEKRNAQRMIRQERTVGACQALAEAIGMQGYPKRIEGFDISNTQGVLSVASMVVFIDGEPAYREYRHYRIKTVEGANDFASMNEVLGRRFARTLREDPAERWVMPDLVLIDGGPEQLRFAREAMLSMGINVPMFGLAKRLEEIYLPNQEEPVVLDHHTPALHLIQRIRDEAHRFAITYHRSLRGKASVHSSLEDIPGVGPARRRALLAHFGSIKKMREADQDELCTVKGMNKTAAAAVYAALHPVIPEDTETEE